MDGTNTAEWGSALARAGLAVVGGLLVLAVARRLAAGEPTRPRDARRIAAWHRATPWLLAVASGTAVVGLGLLWLADG